MIYPGRFLPRTWHLGSSSKNTQRATGGGPATHFKSKPFKPLQLVEALAILVSDFLKALATSGSFDTLLLFGRLFEALALLDIGDDAVLFAGLSKTLESAFERFVGLNNYADHDNPLVK